MTIIKIKAQPNGAHQNKTSDFFSFPLPTGWAIIPENLEIPSSFPFVDIEVENQVVISITEKEMSEYDKKRFQNAQQNKLIELSDSCNQIITAGIDVETTQGIEHFSLTETDQINLTNATLVINQGATAYPYHADGQMCRMFTAEELQDIAQTAIEFKIYQTTLCNHLLTWARRVTTIEELQQITYSADNLPEDLALNMQNVLAASASL